MNAGSGRVGLDIRSTKQMRISHGEWLTDGNGLRYVPTRSEFCLSQVSQSLALIKRLRLLIALYQLEEEGGVAHWMDAAASLQQITYQIL
jgi:hypothetical protein